MRVGEGQIIKRNGLLWYDNEAWQDDRAELERLRAEIEALKEMWYIKGFNAGAHAISKGYKIASLEEVQG